jgi:hypothetical protein
MDAESMARIDASRKRLEQLVASASNDELVQPVMGEWTGAALLAHLAFWDRRAAWLIRRCQQGTCASAPVDLDSINESALPAWRLIPPRAAAQEALDAASDVDGLVARVPSDLLRVMREAKITFDRSTHRNAHLDQIERALGRG